MQDFQGITPVEYKVLILPDEVEDKSAGGMYYPDSERERQQYAMDRGKILAVGNGFFSDIPGPVPQLGDKVIFNKHAGSLINMQINGTRKKVRLCNDKDIFAIVKEE